MHTAHIEIILKHRERLHGDWTPHITHRQCVLQQNSAVNPLQGQNTPPDGFDETEVQSYIVLNRLLSVNDDTYSFKGEFEQSCSSYTANC